MSSVNKVILVGSPDPDAVSRVKSCAKCGAHFSRNRKYSNSQWAQRQFCSRQCGATKRTVKDAEIISMYRAGHSSNDIGATVGLSGAHVLRILKQNAVETREASENKRLSHAKPATKKKMSDSRKGKPLSESARQKLKEITGPQHHGWRSGLTNTAGGYLQFTSSPANGVHAGRLLHQVIAEWVVGRSLRPGEHVHHVDGNKHNNHPDNLQVMTASEHLRLHALASGLGKRKAIA